MFQILLFQMFMDKYDFDRDGHINFTDFVRYVTEHEKALRLSFAMLDHNRDGKFYDFFPRIWKSFRAC